ncbi:MAG: thioredoxin family protein [Candidatus Melainabacteria bacterium]|nr:thioredoxin family protein [Candidatus Melainabacteria bacterium]
MVSRKTLFHTVWLGLLLVALTGLLSLGERVASHTAAADSDMVVIFTARWCASCREIVPIVTQVATEQGLTVKTIDVDQQDAPRTADIYGLTIPSVELPQIYQIQQRKKVSLLFDGRSYRLGNRQQVHEAMILRLRQAP